MIVNEWFFYDFTVRLYENGKFEIENYGFRYTLIIEELKEIQAMINELDELQEHEIIEWEHEKGFTIDIADNFNQAMDNYLSSFYHNDFSNEFIVVNDIEDLNYLKATDKELYKKTKKLLDLEKQVFIPFVLAYDNVNNYIDIFEKENFDSDVIENFTGQYN